MKKPIVGEFDCRRHMFWWRLPNNIEIHQLGFKIVLGDKFRIVWGEEVTGPVSKEMVQELFQVILYPPGSEPSPESADPTHKDRMQRLDEFFKDDPYEIPRFDIKGES